jgi:DNA sulfur modification protein DndE
MNETKKAMQPRNLLALFLVFTLQQGWAQITGTIADELTGLTRDLPFAMPGVEVPSFPERIISIVDFGAVADGYRLNTKAFAGAVDACTKAGGGTVIVPSGTWLTGPIKLQSNVNLHLERGALIQFSKRIEDFTIIERFDRKSRRYVITPPIYADKATNIAITGYGVIDGAGESWRYVKREKLTERQWRELTRSGGVVTPDGREWWPSEEAMKGEEYLQGLEKSGRKATADDYAKAKEFLRPDLVRLSQCNGILLDGPTFQNSPRFHVHLVESEDIIVRDVKILTEWYAQNGDGLDLSSCRNVVVYNITVNVGDDGICVKPGNISEDQNPGPACENIVIADCIVYHAHGGFVIGSESFGGARNISVRNCLFMGTDVGIRCKSARGRGGLIEDVFIDGIQMRAIEDEAILFDMYYGGSSPEVEAQKPLDSRRTEPVNDRTPRFQNFSIKNVVCNGAERAVLIHGLPEMPVRNITFKNVSISAKLGVLCLDAEGIQLDSCRIIPASGPVVELRQSRSVAVNGGRFPKLPDVFLKVVGEASKNIQLVGVGIPHEGRMIELGKGVRPDAVRQN